jgi:hypothetical protein
MGRKILDKMIVNLLFLLVLKLHINLIIYFPEISLQE